jgi:hypothetical protein
MSPHRKRKEQVQMLDEENRKAHLQDKEKHIARIRNLRVIMKIFSSFLMLVTLFLMVLSDVKLRTIVTFEQQIKIITPFVDQHEKDILISNFSRMQSSTDFEKIQNSIEFIASENKITLPKTRHHLF